MNSSLASSPDLTSLAYDPTDACVYALGAEITIYNASTQTLAGIPIPVAPHVASGTIVYDASRQSLYATTMADVDSGTLTEINGQSANSSYLGETVMGVGHSPFAVLPVSLPGSSPSVPSEVWVANAASGTLSIVASSPPQIVSFSALPEDIDVGQNTSLVVSYIGGAGPVAISYSGLPAGCLSANTTRLECGPKSVGNYTVTVLLTDLLGNTATLSTNLTVNLGLYLQVFLATQLLPDVEVNVTLGIALGASGGIGPYHYAWTFGDGFAASGPSIDHTYTSVGTYLLQVNVTDQVGGTSSLEWALDVYARPMITVAASTLRTDVGATVSFASEASGGLGTATTVWLFGDGSITNGTSVTHSWNTPGLYNVTAVFEDQLGDEANWTAQVLVNATPSGNFVVTGGTIANPARPGTQFYYNVTLEGGTGPFSVVWHFGDGSEATGVQVVHSYSAAGNYTVNVVSTDSADVSVNANLSIQVLPTASSNSSSSGPSLNFSLGWLLGIVVGAAIASVVLFAVTARRRKPKSPPPPSPYVPPNRVDWKED